MNLHVNFEAPIFVNGVSLLIISREIFLRATSRLIISHLNYACTQLIKARRHFYHRPSSTLCSLLHSSVVLHFSSSIRHSQPGLFLSRCSSSPILGRVQLVALDLIDYIAKDRAFQDNNGAARNN